jgi:hypothetical protein
MRFWPASAGTLMRRARDRRHRGGHAGVLRPALWPTHPLDHEDGDPPPPFTMIYFGAAGVIEALDWLARRGVLRHGAISPRFSTNRRTQCRPSRAGGPWCRVAADGARRNSVAALATGTVAGACRPARRVDRREREAPVAELLWAPRNDARGAGDARSDPRGPLGRSVSQRCPGARHAVRVRAPARCHLWTQDLYGQHPQYIGAGHGFAGNASAIIRGRALLSDDDRAWWTDRIVEPRTHGAAPRQSGQLAGNVHAAGCGHEDDARPMVSRCAGDRDQSRRSARPASR